MSFQQGLSGLSASSKNLEVIGNNIANANTYGNKASRAEFADMYASSLGGGGGGTAIGIGVMVDAVSQQFTQGNITTTDNPLDLAINGGGFFQVTGADGGQVEYTRNGQFKLDRDGYIVNDDGERLMGYAANEQGTVQTGTAGPLQLPTGGIEPNVTTRIEMEANLDSSSEIPPSTRAISFTDKDTYNESTSQTVFDARGQAVTVSYYFRKTAENTWDVYATANGVPIAGTDAAPQPVTTLEFANGGAAPSAPTDTVTLNLPATTDADGATTEAIAGVALDLDKLTEFGEAFGVTDLTQDGYAPGQLSSMAVENDGTVTARYSNGQSKAAGQIELATFRNPQGLQPVGGNGWLRSFSSGDPVYGVPGSGNLGKLQAGALEESNVDLTAQLVSLITAQRNYQANAQTIKTIDQVMQTIVNLR